MPGQRPSLAVLLPRRVIRFLPFWQRPIPAPPDAPRCHFSPGSLFCFFCLAVGNGGNPLLRHATSSSVHDPRRDRPVEPQPVVGCLHLGDLPSRAAVAFQYLYRHLWYLPHSHHGQRVPRLPAVVGRPVLYPYLLALLPVFHGRPRQLCHLRSLFRRHLRVLPPRPRRLHLHGRHWWPCLRGLDPVLLDDDLAPQRPEQLRLPVPQRVLLRRLLDGPGRPHPVLPLAGDQDHGVQEAEDGRRDRRHEAHAGRGQAEAAAPGPGPRRGPHGPAAVLRPRPHGRPRRAGAGGVQLPAGRRADAGAAGGARGAGGRAARDLRRAAGRRADVRGAGGARGRGGGSPGDLRSTADGRQDMRGVSGTQRLDEAKVWGSRRGALWRGCLSIYLLRKSEIKPFFSSIVDGIAGKTVDDRGGDRAERVVTDGSQARRSFVRKRVPKQAPFDRRTIGEVIVHPESSLRPHSNGLSARAQRRRARGRIPGAAGLIAAAAVVPLIARR
ncbi:hypothetical protein DFJ74DRAFT_472879 [Hyaloraphidium curvatum]|nr:hypothetical protein DFJ74DRAFT_472879 [Hyaloraphidium curvatum]